MSRSRSTALAGWREAPPEVSSLCGAILRESIHRAMLAAERNSKSAAGIDLLDWGKRYLPRHFRRTPSKMHRWIAARLERMRVRRGLKLNVLGPRGGAKSTIGTLALVLRSALEGREPYILIVSNTKHQAVAHLENIKTELRENRQIRADYPRAIASRGAWRDNAVHLANGVLIEAFGTGQRVRGRRHGAYRPTLIVCDDLQDDHHMESALARERSRRWFHGMLMKAGTKRTNIVNLATALHREALALELHATAGWTPRIFAAIERWPDRLDLWDQWEQLYTDLERPDHEHAARTFYRAHRSEMHAGALLLWPEEEDLYTLMCMRVEGGRTAFEREKQNVPINPELCEWPEAYFSDGIWFDDWPRVVRVKSLALDPSKGSDAHRGDYSAFVMLAVDRRGIVYLDANLARRPTPQIVSDGVELCRQFRPDVFGVEVNQFQELLEAEFIAELTRQNMPGVVPWPMENSVNKQTRIRRLGPLLAQRRLRFRSHSPGARLLVEQLKEFPVADHDDGPDAAEMALRLASEWLQDRRAPDGLGSRLPISV